MQRVTRNGSEKRIVSVKGPPRLGSIEAACRLIGGDKPIHPGTYYRGVKRGIYPAPFRTSPNISRVDLDELEAVIRSRAAASPGTSTP